MGRGRSTNQAGAPGPFHRWRRRDHTRCSLDAHGGRRHSGCGLVGAASCGRVFSRPVALGTKIAILAVVNAIGFWGLVSRAYPAKFLLPGTFFLVAFQVIPIIYTVDIALTIYSTGHILSKAAAIKQIEQVTLTETGSGKTFTMTPANGSKGNFILLLVDDTNGKTYVRMQFDCHRKSPGLPLWSDKTNSAAPLPIPCRGAGGTNRVTPT
jgi:hypothetical protein